MIFTWFDPVLPWQQYLDFFSQTNEVRKYYANLYVINIMIKLKFSHFSSLNFDIPQLPRFHAKF